MELKKGTTVKTFIPKVAEGVFTVICMFTASDEYVLYYHSGKKTLRVFRTSDAVMIANYKMQAELTAIRSTKDGQSLVLGTVDGCLSIFCIADPLKVELQELLKTLPSRDPNVSVKESHMFVRSYIFARVLSHFSGRKSWRKSKRPHDFVQLISPSHLHQNSTLPEATMHRQQLRLGKLMRRSRQLKLLNLHQNQNQS